MSRIKAGLVSGVWAFMFVAVVLGVMLNVPVVRGSGTIYIRADGSIDPPTANITTTDHATYIFTGNNYDRIVVERSNIIIDGSGFALQGKGGGDGFYLSGINNVTIKNTSIESFFRGVRLDSASYNVLSGNMITNSSMGGIELREASKYNSIVENNITNSTMSGISLSSESSHNHIVENSITNSGKAISLGGANNMASGNVMSGNEISFAVSGDYPSHSIDDSNLVDGMPVYYLVNQKDLMINPVTHPRIGYLALINCTNVIVENLALANMQFPIVYTKHLSLSNNNMTNIRFLIVGSSKTTIYKNNIMDCNINVRHGSDKTTISQNNITNCGDAILLDGGSYDAVVSENNIINNRMGILLWERTENNRIWGNNIVNNTCGIHVGDAYGETVVYHNNFINNTSHVIFIHGYGSIWDDGFPSGGNYWDDYTGADANGDGIGDIPYTIDPYYHDRYPLMNRWKPSEHEPVTSSEAQAGVKAGDWIKLDYTITGAPSGTPLPQWMKIEFLSVEETTTNVRVTMHMSDGTEPSQTMTVDVAVGSGTFQGLSGFVIPANCTTGDCVYISGYGNVTIAGETTRTYAGASRTVVHASISQLGTQLTYYWDKQIGVMVEASTTSAGITGTAKAAETNMWQAQTVGLPLDQTYLFIIVAVAIAIAVGSIAIVMRRKKKPPEIVTATEPTT